MPDVELLEMQVGREQEPLRGGRERVVYISCCAVGGGGAAERETLL